MLTEYVLEITPTNFFFDVFDTWWNAYLVVLRGSCVEVAHSARQVQRQLREWHTASFTDARTVFFLSFFLT